LIALITASQTLCGCYPAILSIFGRGGCLPPEDGQSVQENFSPIPGKLRFEWSAGGTQTRLLRDAYNGKIGVVVEGSSVFVSDTAYRLTLHLEVFNFLDSAIASVHPDSVIGYFNQHAMTIKSHAVVRSVDNGSGLYRLTFTSPPYIDELEKDDQGNYKPIAVRFDLSRFLRLEGEPVEIYDVNAADDPQPLIDRID